MQRFVSSSSWILVFLSKGVLCVFYDSENLGAFVPVVETHVEDLRFGNSETLTVGIELSSR